MAIENTVSIYFDSLLSNVKSVFDCRLSDVVTIGLLYTIQIFMRIASLTENLPYITTCSKYVRVQRSGVDTIK